MINLDFISNSALAELIDEWIKSERDRAILKRRFIDGKTYDELSSEFRLSVDRIKQIIYKQQDVLFRHIEQPKTEFIAGHEWAVIPT